MAERIEGPSEYKTVPAFVKTVQSDGEDLGVVEHLISVFGVEDLGGDVSHKGMFTKTIQERGEQIRVLDNHQKNSVNNVLGKPLELREVDRSELPQDVLQRYPDATGGLMAKTQFLLDTPEGKGAFTRLKHRAVSEFSFAYDALDYDFEQKGEGRRIRHLRTVRLWEYGPVIFGMNPAAVAVSAKAANEPEEQKNPWGVYKEDGQYCVYKNEGGKKTGKALGCHDTRKEAEAQIRALHANVNEGKALDEQEAYFSYSVTSAKGIEDSSLRQVTVTLESKTSVAFIGPNEDEEGEAVHYFLFDKGQWSKEEVEDFVREEKAVELEGSQLVREVMDSFYHKFWDMDTYYRIQEVYSDYLIVKGSDSVFYYKVAFSLGEDGKFVFAERDGWLVGMLEFVEMQSEADESDETDDSEMKMLELELEQLGLELLLESEAGPAS